MNLVVISGRVVKDNDLKVTKNGTEVLKNSIAVRQYNKDEPLYIDFVAFSNNAKFLNSYGNKGNAVLLRGELMLDKWDDKSTGKTQYKTYVVVNQAELLSSKKQEDKPEEYQPQQEAPADLFQDDDLPF